jgi:hypothetical protein
MSVTQPDHVWSPATEAVMSVSSINQWDRPQIIPLQPEHLLVQALVDDLARARRDEVGLAMRLVHVRKQSAELDAVPWWRILKRIGNWGERGRIEKEMAEIGAQATTAAWTISLNLKTVTAILGEHDEYTRQIGHAMSGQA